MTRQYLRALGIRMRQALRAAFPATRFYAHLSPAHLRAAVERLDGLTASIALTSTPDLAPIRT